MPSRASGLSARSRRMNSPGPARCSTHHSPPGGPSCSQRSARGTSPSSSAAPTTGRAGSFSTAFPACSSTRWPCPAPSSVPAEAMDCGAAGSCPIEVFDLAGRRGTDRIEGGEVVGPRTGPRALAESTSLIALRTITEACIRNVANGGCKSFMRICSLVRRRVFARVRATNVSAR